jgi:hypothetical protein
MIGIADLGLSLPLVIILGVVLAVISLTLWISTLVHQIKRQKYVWFVFTLLWGVTLIVYWIVWIAKRDSWNRRRKRR